MSTSLVVPAYNEEARLPAFLSSVANFVTKHPGDLVEVLVVDDGSTDATLRVASEFRERLGCLRVLRHERNEGKGAAVRTGVMAAVAEKIVFMDADGATDVSELPRMIAALDASEIAVGHRFMPGSETKRSSWLRRVAGWTYRGYMTLFCLGDVDTMCGFKGYRRAVARDLFHTLIDPRWLFDSEVAYRARCRGYAIKSFPIRWTARGGSKLSLSVLVASAWRIPFLMHRVKVENLAVAKVVHRVP